MSALLALWPVALVLIAMAGVGLAERQQADR